MARKKASGVGSGSRRFARKHHPDGASSVVPAARDAATLLYLATQDGEWPAAHEFIGKALYDATWIREGESLVLVEMRPGKGMGSKRTVQVLDVRVEADIFEGQHLQFRRKVLVDEVDEYSEIMLAFASKVAGE